MKSALVFLSTLISVSALAGTFDINDARILGQYRLVKADPNAEIQDIKIVYNTDNHLVLVRDGDLEYPLHAADSSGLVHQSEDECNAGSGDEPDCYYDANFEVRLSSVRNNRGQDIPQVVIDVLRVDGYEKQPQYSYQLKFNWSAEIEDAVPFYFKTENPTVLQDLEEQCKKDYVAVVGRAGNSNRVCHEAESFEIREGIDQKKAFERLLKDWDGFKIISKSQLPQVFAAVDKELANYVRLSKVGSVEKFVTVAQPVRDYIAQNSDLIAFKKPVGGITWLFALDADKGIITQYVVFAR